jgi:hypothetical protein
VEVTLPGQAPRRWHVSHLLPAAAADTTITISAATSSSSKAASGQRLAEGQQLSVAAYFAAAHGITLASPQLPCVGVGRPGGPAIWYPLELCAIPAGQRYRLPLAPAQLAALNRLAAKKAGDRRLWLEGIVGPLAPAAAGSTTAATAAPLGAAAAGAAALTGGSGGTGPAGPLLPPGLEVCGVLGVVRGRVLPAPHLAYATPECAYPGSQVRWLVMCVWLAFAAGARAGLGCTQASTRTWRPGCQARALHPRRTHPTTGPVECALVQAAWRGAHQQLGAGGAHAPGGSGH